MQKHCAWAHPPFLTFHSNTLRNRLPETLQCSRSVFLQEVFGYKLPWPLGQRGHFSPTTVGKAQAPQQSIATSLGGRGLCRAGETTEHCSTEPVDGEHELWAALSRMQNPWLDLNSVTKS